MSKEDLHAQECFLFVCLKNINSACIWPTLSKFSQADSHVTFAVIHSQGTKKKLLLYFYMSLFYILFIVVVLCVKFVWRQDYLSINYLCLPFGRVSLCLSANSGVLISMTTGSSKPCNATFGPVKDVWRFSDTLKEILQFFLIFRN